MLHLIQLFYILINTRALPEEQAIKTTKIALNNLYKAVEDIDFTSPLRIISRGDSTLRGHYPAEVNCILDSKSKGLCQYSIMPTYSQLRRRKLTVFFSFNT